MICKLTSNCPGSHGSFREKKDTFVIALVTSKRFTGSLSGVRLSGREKGLSEVLYYFLVNSNVLHFMWKFKKGHQEDAFWEVTPVSLHSSMASSSSYFTSEWWEQSNITFLSPRLVLHWVKSQANKVSERKGQIENRPHSMEKLYYQKSWKPDSFACCNNAT